MTFHQKSDMQLIGQVQAQTHSMNNIKAWNCIERKTTSSASLSIKVTGSWIRGTRRSVSSMWEMKWSPVRRSCVLSTYPFTQSPLLNVDFVTLHILYSIHYITSSFALLDIVLGVMTSSRNDLWATFPYTKGHVSCWHTPTCTIEGRMFQIKLCIDQT